MIDKMKKDNKARILNIKLIMLLLVILIFGAGIVQSLPDDPPAPVSAPAVTPANPAASTSGSSSFRFVIMGDIHTGFEGGGGNPRMSTVIPKIINDIRPAFVIQLGDIIDIRGAGHDDENCEQCINTMWQRVESTIVGPLIGAGINFYPTSGNHDGTIEGAMGSQMSRMRHDNYWSQLTTRNRNVDISGEYQRYYSFDYGEAHFVGLYSAGAQGIKVSERQLPWLTQDLNQAKERGAKVVFTFSHSPLRAPEMPGNERSLNPFIANSRQVMDELNALVTAGIPVTHFGGHVHAHYEGMEESVRNILPGPLGGGKARLSDGVYGRWSMMVVDVVGDQFQFYTLEDPDFDTSGLPPSPTITNPVPSASVPSSLAGLGTCPPGTRPQLAPSIIPADTAATTASSEEIPVIPNTPAETIVAVASTITSPTPTGALITGAVPTEPGAAQPAPTPVLEASTTATTGCGSKIAAVGDSLTAGSASYVRFLRTMCGDSTTIKNTDDDESTSSSNMGGDHFAYVSRKTDSMKDDFNTVLAWNPETIILLGGTNDINQGWAWTRTRDNLIDMINRAKARNIRVVSVIVPPYLTASEIGESKSNNMLQLNNWLNSSDNPADIKVDIHNHFALTGTHDINPSLFGGDRIHPNPEGQQLLARLVHASLTGSPVPTITGSTTPGAPGSPGTSPVAGASTTVCVPDSAVPRLLYDFLINSSAGLTTIIGIARQNIAVGINKTPRSFGIGAVCAPLTADLDYDLERLKQTYGRSQQAVEAQLVSGAFMEQPIQIHRLISPVFGCVERELDDCPEAQDYEFRAVESYRWQALPEDPEMLTTGSFGIAININIDENPNAQDGELITDIPQCIIDSFRMYGFRWGGDYETSKNPAHFEFMADPNRIVVQEAVSCPEGMVTSTDSASGLRTCVQAGAGALALGDVPIAADENGGVKRCVAEAINALGNEHPYVERAYDTTKHPTCCGDWVAMVYKWCGYTYDYKIKWWNNLQELANEYGYPIGFNVNTGSQGHALVLLGFGPEANWWLEQFPDIPVSRHARDVGTNEALVISYLGSEAQRVAFNIVSRTNYPGNRISNMPGTVGEPAKVKTAHPWTPLCASDYVEFRGNDRFSSRYVGQMMWSNDRSGAGGPWSRFFEPAESPYYPIGGDCTRQGVPTVAGGRSTSPSSTTAVV